MGVRAVDLDLGEQRERHVVLVGAKLADLGLVARLLMAELVAREAEHGEAARAKAPVQRFEAGVLRGEAASAREIDDQQRLARKVAERMRLAVDCFKRDVSWQGHAELQRASWLRSPLDARREVFYPLSFNVSNMRCANEYFHSLCCVRPGGNHEKAFD